MCSSIGRTIRTVFAVASAAAAVALVGIALAAPGASSLLEVADAALHALDEGVIRVRVTLIEADAGPRAESILDVYVHGPDRALCVFREGLQANRRILMAGDKVWLIVPAAAHPIPITARHRVLGGASVADLAHLSLSREFSGTVRPDPDVVDGATCHVVELAARSPRSAYAKGTLWIGIDDGLPRRLRLALPSGKEAKDIVYGAYVRTNGRTVLQAMEVRHLLRAERGTITRLEFLSYTPRPLPPDVFDPAGAATIP